MALSLDPCKSLYLVESEIIHKFALQYKYPKGIFNSLHSSMDRISDSGSDDYGSTPYGDTCKSLYLAFTQQNIAISFFSYWHITDKISDSVI